jgi:predicted negative regulator of RcsB-dependent stress response
VDRQTRHDLKSDKFVQEVGETISFLEKHRPEIIRYGGTALAVLIVAGAGWFYWKSRQESRQAELTGVIQVYNAGVTESAPPGMVSFRTEAEKSKAVEKALNDLVVNHAGSEEAAVGTYLLGLHASDQGKVADAERYLKKASEDAGKDYSALAKLALAQVYSTSGKVPEAEKLLRDLMSNPTVTVSKEQATLTLARVLVRTKPDEARKLLEPLRTQSGTVSRIAINEMADLGLVK